MVIIHGTVDCFFLLCRNAAILSFLFSLTKFQTRLLVTVSFQSRSSVVPVDLSPIYFDAMSRSAWFLVLLYGRGWPASKKLRS